MHDAAAGVAGGTLLAMDGILSGETAHAFHPGGGLHHAFPGRAGGFCIYNDLAIAIRRARDAGHRVLYVDIDAHHGDGVEAIFWDDPLVQTISIHETGLTLFPGSGFEDDHGGHGAEGSAVNIPLEAGTSDASWLEAVERVVPAVADAFRPDGPRDARRAATATISTRCRTWSSRRRRCTGPRACSTGWRIATRAAAGWRPEPAATTSTAWCPAPGPSSGWRWPTGTCRSRSRPHGASAGQPTPGASASTRCPTVLLDGPGVAPAEPPESPSATAQRSSTRSQHTLRILRERAAAEGRPG